ncbi:MAG: polysaccharide biosynthesis protein [Oscillospiraceae bacterium]|nr:polysaccharide biosynthesis protein [Oscillospiraceae bacterium]
MEPKERKQNFLTGAAILSVSTIIVKIIGMFYKIPLKGIIGDAGYAYFNAAYSIYSVLLIISTTGLPVAMSRMVSEAHTLGNGRQMKRVFHTALIAYLSIGLLGTAVMMLLPRFLAGTVMGMPNASYSIFALGPAVVFICFASAGRGFFQGQGDMKPTAVSQIIEAAGKLILGLGLAWTVMRQYNDEALSSGATIAGISIGAGCSALYAFMKIRRNNGRIDAMGGTALSYKATAKKLLAIAIPITIGSAGLQLINLLDEVTVTHRMLSAAESSGVMIDRVLALAGSSDVQYAVENAKGVYSFAQTIFNLPISLIPCITVAIIPAITSYLTLKDNKGVKSTQDSSVRIMSLIAMPCTVGLLVMSEPVMALLGGYEGDELVLAGWLLALLTPTILTNSIANMTTAIMQAHNHTVLPVINTLIGGLLKVAVNYILVGNPDIAILGAPIGTFVCYLVIMLLNVFAMRRTLKEPPKLLPAIWRSGLAALLMGVVAWLAYGLLGKLISSVAVCCLGAIAVAAVVYLVLVILFKALTYEDCLLLPKGEKIAKLLRIR